MTVISTATDNFHLQGQAHRNCSMRLDSEVEAFVAGHIAARSRLKEPLILSANLEFEPVLLGLQISLADLGIQSVYGIKGERASLKLASSPAEWRYEVPREDDIDERLVFAYCRGAFEANGCFTTSTKRVNDQVYKYERIQFYYREGEEWIADFVRAQWLKWLGDLGLNRGKEMAITLIPRGQSNRQKDTYQFAVSGKRKEIVQKFMYWNAKISLERMDLI